MFPNAGPGGSQASAAAGAVPTADGNGGTAWLVPGAPAGFAVVRVPTVYDVAGADTHVVSAACIGLVDLEAVGGGGSSSADGLNGSGAGGGYAATFNVPVTPADVLDVVVGAGGAVNPGSDNGLPGVASSVADDTPTVLCEAGGGGGAVVAGAPAAGGAVTTGDLGRIGGAGFADNTQTVIPGGASGYGGVGGVELGVNESAPGIGGGGCGQTAGNGQAGGTGRVVVWEYQLVAI